MAPYCNNYHRYHSNKCFKIIVNFYLYFMLIIKSILCFAPPTTTTLNPVLTIIPPISNQIRETVVIPISENLEREAQELYNKALKEFAATDIPELNDICRTWEEFGCQCWDKYDETINLTCRGVNFKSMDALIWPQYLAKLELSNNNITMLPYNIFDLPHLRELVISSNPIRQIDPNAFIGLGNLRKITIKYCDIKEFLPNVFHHLQHLNFIQFTGNFLKQFHPESFTKLTLLKNLYLDGNHVETVTAIPLSDVKLLEVLNLANNRIREINVGDFPVLNKLVILLLKRNQITEIASGSFLTMKSLEVINLDDNQLTRLPPDLVKLHHLQELFASGNKIKFITDDALPKNLVILELRTNPLISFKNGSLHHMSRLRKLTLSDSKNLFELPSLHGCESLETLWVDRAKLTQFPNNLCQTAPKLKSLELKSNLLRTIPRLIGCHNLRMLDLSGNRIDSVHGTPFQGLISLNDLLLSHNEIATIPFDAFHGIPNIELLDLEGNYLNFIHQDAFTGFNRIKDLNLGNNIFPDLPTIGLKTLNHLKTFNNPKLKEFPSPSEFPKIQTLVLSYAYHCCEFLPLKVESDIISSPYSEKVFVLPPGADVAAWFNKTNGNFQNITTNKMTPEMKDFFQKFAQDYGSFPNIPLYEEYLEDAITTKTTDLDYLAKSIQCLPLPDPFLPCQDLFDWWTLRCGVWVVFLLAMLGNGTVVFVLIFSRSKMDVPRFLVCNLAAADFFMGVYLGLLAVVDASTLGEFRMFAIPWQMSAGCQLAGFLAVLSSELSVYTLAVITLERNYAITHAMHLNKRLSLRHAGYIMAIGWMFALTMACLPLFGISDYRKFAVCLPFETTTGTGSLAYVVFLMFINGVAFLILMGCYLKMYCAIRGSQAWNSNDSRIAKRMALLVFTDFICWSPIAFFSLTAVFGLHLISLEQAKVFTVFVLPLNSCCNPFLYAILTKQFKKDCVLICKAIEESRVTRGIGRCRHSSNFSNRQTPANTNSLVERSSRDLMPPILPGQTCACAKLLQEQENSHRHSKTQSQTALAKVWHNLLCHTKKKDTKRGKRSDQYAHQIAEIQQKQHKRAGSMSSSENFSSSRSDSWRHGAPHHYCGIQLRKLDPRWRHSSWLITRKTSQDSNLSSSRNDSSGSNTTASTSTWRMSRSSAGASTPIPQLANSFNTSISRQSIPGAKPRLVRQSAVNDDSLDLSSSPPRLGVRFLPTIPSAADSSIQLDDDCQFNDSGNNSASNENDNLNSIIINSIEGENNNSNNNSSSSSNNNNNNNNSNGTQYYAVLQSGNPLTTLSSPKDKTKPP